MLDLPPFRRIAIEPSASFPRVPQLESLRAPVGGERDATLAGGDELDERDADLVLSLDDDVATLAMQPQHVVGDSLQPRGETTAVEFRERGVIASETPRVRYDPLPAGVCAAQLPLLAPAKRRRSSMSARRRDETRPRD